MKIKLEKEEAMKRLHNIFPFIDGEYITSQTRTEWICRKHNAKFYGKYYLLVQGHNSCPRCIYEKRYRIGEVINDCTVISKVDEKSDSGKKIKKYHMKCNKCGNLFYRKTLESVQNASTPCPNCRRLSNLPQYEFHDDYVIGRKHNHIFVVDLDDYGKIKDKNWHYKSSDGYLFYVGDGRKETLMHRFIMNEYDPNIFIDHINHDKCDNRKINLRRCVSAENSKNMKRVNKKSSTGITGVGICSWDKNKYRARIQYKGKELNLGYFYNIDDAIKARKEAEEKYYGEFAYNPDAPRIEVS